MKQNNTYLPTFKEIETDLFRLLQETYGSVLGQMLMDMDERIAENRDKSRFQLRDKRPATIDCMFGSIEIRRNYYFDRSTKKYVFLLDQHLEFDGAKGLSPLVQEAAMELAVTGTSYRHASKTLEMLLGYSVVSHEAIRQHLIQTEVVPSGSKMPARRVLFVEVDGLYVKRQGKGNRRREEKIAAVHEGWKVNGKRTSLVGKRHYHHEGKQPFWEGFEEFLMDTYNYNPNEHYLIINGDGAEWITTCREHFKHVFFTIDRFHVARDVRTIFKEHKRYRSIRKKLASYDSEGFMVELNSAVGTLEDERKEELLEALIGQLSKYPEALGDYRKWLREKDINIDGMRPMGAAEGTMRVFAKRLKNGRAWSDKGLKPFIHAMIAFSDDLDIKTSVGKITKRLKLDNKPPRHYVEKLTSRVGEATRQNIAYLQQATGKPIHEALKGLQGF